MSLYSNNRPMLSAYEICLRQSPRNMLWSRQSPRSVSEEKLEKILEDCLDGIPRDAQVFIGRPRDVTPLAGSHLLSVEVR